MIRLPDWPPAWQPLLQSQALQLDALSRHIEHRRQYVEVYPLDPLRLFRLLTPEQVRVVILGQDPYHGSGQATGLAFSVAEGMRVPPSLRNILAEVRSDVGQSQCDGGQLEPWVGQGVLLLNAVLTVEQASPQSHAGLGWEPVVQTLLRGLVQRPLGWLLWGNSAARLAEPVLADAPAPQAVWRSNHPSPRSARRPPAPFLGSRPFSQVNDWLVSQGQEPVRW
jgi:uracil-DNA glycosylase